MSRLLALWAVLALPAFAKELVFHNGAGPAAALTIHRPYSNAPLDAYRVRLTLGGARLEKGYGGLNTIAVDGLTPLSQPGAPDVPVTGVIFALPPGVAPQLEIVRRTEVVEEAAPLQPCQPGSRCPRPEGEPFRFDTALYESHGVFPAQVAALQEVGKLQGLRLVRLALAPLRMRLDDGALLATTDLEVEVRFAGEPGPFSIAPSLAKFAMQSAVNGKVVATAAAAPTPETMLVVVADSLATTITPWLEWKRQRGLNVQVTTYSAAGGSKNSVQSWVRNAYKTAVRKPSFLVFVGNKNTMPGFVEKVPNGNAATDYPYALLEGNDSVPDILYGRLLADSVAEAQTQVKRWIAYERDGGGTWLSDAMVLASREGQSPSDEGYAQQIQNALTKYTYKTVQPFFERTKTARTSDLLKAFSEGKSWVTYFGHGSGTSWVSTNDDFDVSDVAKVRNPGKLPFIVDVACENASWIYMSRCFGKAWVSGDEGGEPQGAVAYYGGSVPVNWHEPAVMAIGVARYHFEKPVQTAGATVFAGQIYLMEKMGMGANVVENLKVYNLFGDPSLLLRTKTPKRLSVLHEAKQTATGWTIDVQTVDTLGNPVKNAFVSIYSQANQKALAAGPTDATGLASFSGEGQPGPADLLLTATGYNLSTYQETLTLTP